MNRPEIYEGNLKNTIEDIKNMISNQYSSEQLVWYAVKYFENDEKTVESTSLEASTLAAINEIRKKFETDEDDDAESIITNARYNYIAKIISCLY